MNHSIGDVPIHCAPTGSGKTIIQAFVAKREMDRGNRTAILTPREEIFNQTEGVLRAICGDDNVGTLKSGRRWNRSKPVHIVSWDTLKLRVKKDKLWYPDVERLLVDECHLAMAPKVSEVLDYYLTRAAIDGYTATPARKSGKGLGRFFTEIKHVRSVRQLIKEGWLVPCEYWGGKQVDTTGLKINQGDYEVGKLAERSIKLAGDVVDNWLRLARDRHSIVFAVNIAHAEALADRFRMAGILAEAVHVKKTPAQRFDIVERFKARDFQILTNVGIASYGFDCPEISCVVAARKTKSLVLWLQAIGRGMRPAEGKKDCMILDHGGNTDRLGEADDLYRWRLDEGKKAVDNWTRQEAGDREDHVHTCEECQHIFSAQMVCPNCGWEVPQTKTDVETTDEELVRIGGHIATQLPDGWPEHKIFYQMLLHYGKEKGYKPGWAAMQFKKLADCWPDRFWMNLAGIPPDARVVNWITKQQQNYARRASYAKRKNTA